MNNKYLIAGNWKMNPANTDEAKKIIAKAKAIASKVKRTEVVPCPPLVFTHLAMSKKLISNYHVGAQIVSMEENIGARTGEVSAMILKNIGVEYVIIGHSEQRARGETDANVSKRTLLALAAGLKPVVCVGELVRDDNGQYLETLKNQIKNSLADIPSKFAKNITIAYEPVWAIGAQEAMNPEQIYEMSLFVKKVFADVFGTEAGMRVRVLYGGSVNFRNAPDIIFIGKVDGLLVGRESVNAIGFVELIKAVDNVKR